MVAGRVSLTADQKRGSLAIHNTLRGNNRSDLELRVKCTHPKCNTKKTKNKIIGKAIDFEKFEEFPNYSALLERVHHKYRAHRASVHDVEYTSPIERCWDATGGPAYTIDWSQWDHPNVTFCTLRQGWLALRRYFGNGPALGSFADDTCFVGGPEPYKQPVVKREQRNPFEPAGGQTAAGTDAGGDLIVELPAAGDDDDDTPAVASVTRYGSISVTEKYHSEVVTLDDTGTPISASYDSFTMSRNLGHSDEVMSACHHLFRQFQGGNLDDATAQLQKEVFEELRKRKEQQAIDNEAKLVSAEDKKAALGDAIERSDRATASSGSGTYPEAASCGPKTGPCAACDRTTVLNRMQLIDSEDYDWFCGSCMVNNTLCKLPVQAKARPKLPVDTTGNTTADTTGDTTGDTAGVLDDLFAEKGDAEPVEDGNHSPSAHSPSPHTAASAENAESEHEPQPEPAAENAHGDEQQGSPPPSPAALASPRSPILPVAANATAPVPPVVSSAPPSSSPAVTPPKASPVIVAEPKAEAKAPSTPQDASRGAHAQAPGTPAELLETLGPAHSPGPLFTMSPSHTNAAPASSPSAGGTLNVIALSPAELATLKQVSRMAPKTPTTGKLWAGATRSLRGLPTTVKPPPPPLPPPLLAPSGPGGQGKPPLPFPKHTVGAPSGNGPRASRGTITMTITTPAVPKAPPVVVGASSPATRGVKRARDAATDTTGIPKPHPFTPHQPSYPPPHALRADGHATMPAPPPPPPPPRASQAPATAPVTEGHVEEYQEWDWRHPSFMTREEQLAMICDLIENITHKSDLLLVLKCVDRRHRSLQRPGR